MMAYARCALGLLILVLLEAPAFAGETEERAKRFFDAGGIAYGRARYADAARAFEECYRIAPRPAIGFSLAQALRRQYFVDRDPKRLHRAIELLSRYLVEVPEGGRRQDVVALLEVLVPLRASLEPSAPEKEAAEAPRTELMVYTSAASATVTIDGARVPGSGAIVEVTPGARAVEVAAPGYFTEARTVLAVDGRLIPVEIALRARPARVTIEGPDGATVFIDGSAPRDLPLSRPLELPAGTHELVIQKRGLSTYQTSLVLERDGSTAVRAVMETTTERRLSLYTLGAAGVLAAAGAVTLGLALHFENRGQEIEGLRGEENAVLDDLYALEDHVERRDALRTTTIVLLSGATIAATAGLTLFLVDAPAIAVGPTHGGAIAGYAGTF